MASDKLLVSMKFTNIFGKKKLKEDTLANVFVNTTLELVENSFGDIVGLIKDSPEFIVPAEINENDDSKFMLIVLAANLKEIPKHLDAHQDNRIINLIITKLAAVYNVEFDKLESILRDYQSYLSRVNLPSQNNLYAMSKAIFFKYNLGQYQEEYFRNMNVPNPLFLKRMDEAMQLFLFNWKEKNEAFHIIS